MILKLKQLIAVVAIAAAFTACKAPKDITYFQDLSSGDVITLQSPKDIVAEPDDRLLIVVQAQDPTLAEMFNTPIQSYRLGFYTGNSSAASRVVSNSSNNQVTPYVVNPNGCIDFPVIGEIKVAGLNRSEIEKLITSMLEERQLLKKPKVSVQFLDHSVTVLGSVNHPGRILFDRDQINLIEAIGLAGDLTIDGVRTNVLVMRNEDGKDKIYTVDLTDAKSLYNSPVFYVRQNDVIYVEPNDRYKRSSTAVGNTPFTPSFWLSVASLATTITALIINIK